MQAPKVSIIIPTFNAARTLAATLDSVVCQTYPHKEVWLIDGASTDDTLAIIQTYAARCDYIYWLSEKDTGIYDAMNKGIRRATGEWLYFLGSDDRLFAADVLEKVFVPAHYVGVQFLYGDIQWQTSKRRYAGEIDIDRIVRTNPSHQAIFYHRTVFEKYPTYHTAYKVCADWYLNMLCYLDERICKKYIALVIAEFYEYGFGSVTEDTAFRQAADKLIYEQFIHKVSPACRHRLYEDLVLTGIGKIASRQNTLQGIGEVLKGAWANRHLLRSIRDILYWLWKR